MTLGNGLPGDTMGGFKSKCVLVCGCKSGGHAHPRRALLLGGAYNGTEIVTIAPDFNATAIHSSKWLHPKPAPTPRWRCRWCR